uniref:Uncharacterized protein n=1 Tax=Lotharella oceanica TaxID=641309 RepID=A0A7S2TKR1_9EUKA
MKAKLKELFLESKGVVAVVGCGPGLGSSVAFKFAERGFDVALMSRKAESCADVQSKIKALDRKTIFVSTDVTDEKRVAAAFKEVEETLGPVKVLVFNASGPNASGAGILGMTIDDVKSRWNVECLGALLCARAVLPGMLREKCGTLLFTSSTAAFRGSASSPGLAMSKHGLRALSSSIAKEFASQGIHACNIRIDCGIATPKVLKKYPNAKGKLGDPDEIAKTYYYLATQSKMAWTNEIDIRPHTENWTC